MHGDSGHGVRHPRALFAFRVGLVLFGLFVGALVATVTVGYLTTVMLVGGLAAVLTGSVGPLALGGFLLLGVVVGGLSVGGLALGLRRVDRHVVAADRRPDPVARAKARYVADELDERELERELEGPLAEEHRREREVA